MAKLSQPTELLPGENPNLTNEIIETIGKDWLHARNANLPEAKAPVDLIGTPDEVEVRWLVRSILAADPS